MTAHERRIVVTGGPWPERIGCHGVVVNDPGDGVYPFDKPSERAAWPVIRLDADPINPGSRRSWSCVIDARHIEMEAP